MTYMPTRQNVVQFIEEARVNCFEVATTNDQRNNVGPMPRNRMTIEKYSHERN